MGLLRWVPAAGDAVRLGAFLAVVGLAVGVATLAPRTVEGWLALRAAVAAEGWLAVVLTIPAYAILTQGFIPPVILHPVCGVVFGPVAGFWVSFGGVNLAASLGFVTARFLARGPVERILGAAGQKLRERLSAVGWRTVVLIRIVGIPFQVVNLSAGLSPLSYVHFALGTLLGTTPGILLLVAAPDGVALAVAGRWREAMGDPMLLMGGALWLVAVGATMIRRRRPAGEPTKADAPFSADVKGVEVAPPADVPPADVPPADVPPADVPPVGVLSADALPVVPTTDVEVRSGGLARPMNGSDTPSPAVPLPDVSPPAVPPSSPAPRP